MCSLIREIFSCLFLSCHWFFPTWIYFTLGPIKDFLHLSAAKECLYLCSRRVFQVAGADDGHKKMGRQRIILNYGSPRMWSKIKTLRLTPQRGPSLTHFQILLKTLIFPFLLWLPSEKMIKTQLLCFFRGYFCSMISSQISFSEGLPITKNTTIVCIEIKTHQHRMYHTW